MKALIKKILLLIPALFISTCVLAAVAEPYADGESELTQNYIRSAMKTYFSPERKKTQVRFQATDGWILEKWNLNNLPMEKLSRNQSGSNRVILQFHGGGYVLGFGDGYRKFALKQAESINADTVYMFDYRHAPEYTYPAALDDAVTAYRRVLADGIAPENVIFMGDSAGGNLALVLGVKLKELDLPQPRGMILMSPWTAMDNVPSHLDNRDKDAVLGEGTPLYPEMFKLSYAKNHKPDDPGLSPLYADLTGLPPLLIQAGGFELLYSDSELLHKAADKADVTNIFSVYSGMPHDFVLVLPELPQSRQAFDQMGEFVQQLFDNEL